MKNFDWTQFTRKIAIKAAITDIYNAWTKASEIEKWFLRNADSFDGDKKLVSKNQNVRKGFTYLWSWYLYDIVEGGSFTEANDKDFIQFTFAGNCLVDIKLSSVDDFVIVELTQRDIPTDDESKQNVRLGCDSGWSFFLVNLKSFYENGVDLRNKNNSHKGMINN